MASRGAQLVEVKEEPLEEPLDPPAASRQPSAGQPGCSPVAGVHVKVDPETVWLKPDGILLHPVGFLYTTQVVYRVGDPQPATTTMTVLTQPSQTGTSRTGTFRSGPSQGPRSSAPPRVKKPPNAFLLFLKAWRQSVVDECHIRSNAAVNAILGERWSSMTPEEQAPYFQQAHAVKRLHEEQQQQQQQQHDSCINSFPVQTPQESPNPTAAEFVGEEAAAQRQSYVKRPLNAFMLFTRKQRASVLAESNITNNATLNAILGSRWKSMTAAEKEPYFKEALTERQRHQRLYPAWTPTGKHGKKKRRDISVLQKPHCIAVASPPSMECPEASQ